MIEEKTFVILYDITDSDKLERYLDDNDFGLKMGNLGIVTPATITDNGDDVGYIDFHLEELRVVSKTRLDRAIKKYLTTSTSDSSE